MLFNKSQFKVANNKKLLRKIGKKWVTVSALTLALLGGGAVMATTVTHADTTIPAVKAQATTEVKKQINNNLDKAYQTKNNAQSGKGDSVSSASSSSASQSNVAKPSNIQSKATNMYRGLMMNAVNNSNKSSSSSASTKSSMASSGSVSSPAKPSFNSAYQSYMAKMSGTDNEVANDNDNDNNTNTQSNNKNIKKPLLKDSNDDSQYFSGGVKNTGTYLGLNYTVYNNGGVEFTGGTAKSDLSLFLHKVTWTWSEYDNRWESTTLTPYNVASAKAIKFDNDVDTSHVTNMMDMFGISDTENDTLQLIDFGDNFNTSKVSDMYQMFFDDNGLKHITFSKLFNVNNGCNVTSMFLGVNPISITIQTPNTKFKYLSSMENNLYKELPEKDSQGKNYTLSTPNDLKLGNVGTFVNYCNPAPSSDNAIINFQSNNKTIKSVTTPKQAFGKHIFSSVNDFNKLIPNNYELTDPNQAQYLVTNAVASGDTYTVPVKINYDEVINSLVNEASSESTAIASYEASSAYISNADKWVQSNSNNAQSADSWVASNSSNATHASSQASTNSSAISSLSASTNANHSADSNSIVSLSNSVASASNAISSNSTTDSSIINSLASSASHAMVVGTAFLTLLYKKGNRTNGQVLRLHINGNIGDSPIVINPQNYDRDGYSVASSDNVWKIPFNYTDVKKATNDFSRYNVENTFTYQAYQIPIDITYFDTQTNHKLNSDNLGKIAYDGDTADLQGTDDDNNILSVDGHEYHLNLPSGYHLAHANNYIKVASNGTYVKPVTTDGGTRMLRMPLMKLTLGITPHFNKHTTKPASSSSVTPVKPSSASSVTPSSANSVQSSSASTAPSSASQSVAPSSTASVTPIVLPSSEASSASKPSSVAPASEVTKPTSASASLASNVATKPVVKPTTHKNTAKHSEARLNHSISQATKQLSTVESHMKARKATEAKIVKKLVHAKKTIKRSQHKLTYLHHNKRHVAHALRRITRNKVAIKHAKRVIHSVKATQAKRVTDSKVTNIKATKSTAKSIKNSVNTPKAKAQSTVTKKLPQTSEANHAGLVALILMIASAILAGFGKLFDRKRTE